MAGTIANTIESMIGQTLVKYTIAWTSDASGDVNTNAFEMKRGAIYQAKFIPSSSAAPTASYDVVLNDQDGADLLQGAGADLSATIATAMPFDARPIVDSDTGETVDLVVTNAGNAKEGSVVVLLGPII